MERIFKVYPKNKKSSIGFFTELKCQNMKHLWFMSWMILEKE